MNNTITYGVTRDVYELNGKQRESYGIVAYANNDFATIVASVRDISTDRNRIECMTKRFNELSLSLIHFNDAVEDELGE